MTNATESTVSVSSNPSTIKRGVGAPKDGVNHQFATFLGTLARKGLGQTCLAITATTDIRQGWSTANWENEKTNRENAAKSNGTNIHDGLVKVGFVAPKSDDASDWNSDGIDFDAVAGSSPEMRSAMAVFVIGLAKHVAPPPAKADLAAALAAEKADNERLRAEIAAMKAAKGKKAA